jgi:hypothetical protein
MYFGYVDLTESDFDTCSLFFREYLATFKKTVAMHEMFLTRLAHHPVFRNDHNLRVFLEYDQDLCVRGKY